VTVGSFPITIEAGLFVEKKGKFEVKANNNEWGNRGLATSPLIQTSFAPNTILNY